MIWALLAWLLLGGAAGFSGAILTSASVQDLSERMAIIVDDTGRRETATMILDRLEKDVRAFENEFADSGQRLTRWHRDHSGNREEALTILGELNSEWEDGQRRALDARFELREKLTKDEWAALFSPQ